MNIIKSDLVSAMKEALPGVEAGNTILEGADTFIFKDGFIYSYNDNISVAVPYNTSSSKDEPIYLQGAVKAKEFFDLINRIKTDNIKIISKDNKWIIKNESMRAELSLIESSIMEHISKIQPVKPKWIKLPEKFFDALKVCIFTSNKSSLSGIYCSNEMMVSTDEIRINQYILDQPINEAFWITDNAANELLKLNDIEKYFVDKSWVHFLSKSKTMFSCKRLQNDLYPFDKIMKLVEDNTYIKGDIKGILPRELISAVSRASTLAMDIESFNSIKLTFTSEHIEVYSERPSGKYTETVKWEKPIKNFPEVSIFIDFSFIEQGIANSTSFYLKQDEGKASKIIFKHDNGLQIVNTFEGGNE
jgi:DNA polymerase III sliding clamp (beta) subunit (PCNA family)